jgi:uncharacterized protein YhdP
MMKQRRAGFLFPVTLLLVCIALAVLMRNANRIVKCELESALGKNFSIGKIQLNWWQLEAIDIQCRYPEGRALFTTDHLILNPGLTTLFRKEYVISSLTLINPYILVRTDRHGNFVTPFTPKRLEKKKKQISDSLFLIKKIKIIHGSLDYLDEKVSEVPVLTRVKDIELVWKDISLPL